MTAATGWFVKTADVHAAVKGRETEILDTLNINWKPKSAAQPGAGPCRGVT
jgi:hypothetical protein